MEQISITPVSPYRQPKRRVIFAAAVFCAVLAPFLVFFDEGGMSSRVLDFVSLIGFGILILGWCYYDSLEQGKPLGNGFRLLVVLFGIIALFIYLVKSRGFKRGLRAIGAALLVCAGMILIMFISALVVYLVSGME